MGVGPSCGIEPFGLSLPAAPVSGGPRGSLLPPTCTAETGRAPERKARAPVPYNPCRPVSKVPSLPAESVWMEGQEEVRGSQPTAPDQASGLAQLLPEVSLAREPLLPPREHVDPVPGLLVARPLVHTTTLQWGHSSYPQFPREDAWAQRDPESPHKGSKSPTCPRPRPPERPHRRGLEAMIYLDVVS